ncbi:MAG: hypothetical protein ACRC6M_17295 [Microcystaceae cyanobacterium]
MINYPDNCLIYWKNSNRETLKTAVTNYFNEIATDEEVPILADYLKHWVSFPAHGFEDESDRVILLGELDNCQTLNEISEITDKLLCFGIDPF